MAREVREGAIETSPGRPGVGAREMSGGDAASRRHDRPPIVLVDDETDVLESESAVLHGEGFGNILTFHDPLGVVESIHSQDAEVVLLDLTLPRRSGEELLGELRERFPHVPVIVITGTADIDTAVRCMKAGAFDYMVKPVERNRFLSGVRRAIEVRGLKREVNALRLHFFSEKLDNPQAFAQIKTRSRAMLSIFHFMEAIASTREPVLIVGETGVGKELVAQTLHTLSGRSGELVTVNAASLDDTMLSDTLFGHRKGAYTGATEARGGLLAAAEAGSVFLDEIGDTTTAIQLKLLRLVEKGEYFPLGSDVPHRTDARFIFATNRSLDHLTNPATFRRDLYYRLSTHQILVPPLRERPEDIPLLLEHLLAEACAVFGKPQPPLPGSLLELLCRHSFPGNVRELRSMVFDSVGRMGDSTLPMESFEVSIRKLSPNAAELPAGKPGCPEEPLPTLHQATERLIHDALNRSHGNIAAAARALGISHQALGKRLKRSKQAPD